MSKIVALLPGTEIYDLARKLIQKENFAIDEIKCINIYDYACKEIIEEARRKGEEAKESGAKIIVSRGNSATIVKNHTHLEVVEIVMTAQEMAMLVRKAIEISGRENPIIAIVGWQNMVCDMSHFGTLFNVDLRIYLAADLSELTLQCKRAIDERVDVIIGDSIAVNEAELAGIRAVNWMPTEDSLRVAFKTAEKLKSLIDSEETAKLQMNTLMDTFASGIIRLDQKGTIISINRTMEKMLDRHAADCIGLKATEVLNMDSGELQQILLTGVGNYSSYLRVRGKAIFAVTTPVCNGDIVQGAILSCSDIKGFSNIGSDILRQQLFKGCVACCEFEDISSESPSMKKELQLARRFALSQSPILIAGETGTEKSQLAQSIHNASNVKNGAYVDVSVGGLSSEAQAKLLFGDSDESSPNEQKLLSAFEAASRGTLFIKEIDCLSLQNQYRLFGTLVFKNNSPRLPLFGSESEVRVIAETSAGLWELVREGKFREDLYYLLSGLCISLPPLRERVEDVRALWKRSLDAYLERYDTYRVLTAEAEKLIEAYSWPGNIIQLDRVCERLVVSTQQRSIGEEHVRAALEESGLPMDIFKSKLAGVASSDESVTAVMEVLAKNDGSRQNAAKELGISTTTLWRFMKKNQIEYPPHS